MLNPEQIKQIQTIPITSYLASKGIKPVLESGGEYCYFSPFRTERTPSFFVNLKKNLFIDFSDEKGGNVINLCRQLDNVNFVVAVQILQKVDTSFEIELQQNLPASPQYQSFIKRITPVTHKALTTYLTVYRKLNPKIVKSELSEIHYTTSKGDFFSSGFKNQSGGWELRNQSFKGCIGKKDISIRGNVHAVTAMIFEGFIDYLSFLSGAGPAILDTTHVIILNSVSLVSRVPDLSQCELITLFLDNNEAGLKAANKIMEKYLTAWNGSKLLFPGFDDYNDFFKNKVENNEHKTTENRGRNKQALQVPL